MSMIIYDSSHSNYARRARLLAAELGIEIERRTLDWYAGDFRTPEYLAKNPGGRVPTLEDGDVTIFESVAICKYLAQQKPERGMWPADPVAQAHIDQWLFWWVSHPAVSINALARELFVKPSQNKPTSADMFANANEQLARDLPTIEGLLGDKDYMLGELGLVDFVMIPQMEALPKVQIDMTPYPRIAAWIARMVAKPYWATA